MTSAHSTRKTSIRTRKIRGEDSLLSSISIAEREEGTGGIAGVIRCEGPLTKLNMAQRGREKSPFGDGKRELRRETGLRHSAYFINVWRLKLLAGFRMTGSYLEALAAIAVSLSILMAIAWMGQRRTGNSGWVDTIWSFAVGLVGASSALWPIGGSANARQWLVAALVVTWSLR